MSTMLSPRFLYEKHVQYFRSCLIGLPKEMKYLDASRMNILFFALSGLGVLDAIQVIPQTVRKRIIDWIYLNQITLDDLIKFHRHSLSASEAELIDQKIILSDPKLIGRAGFRGSPACGRSGHAHDCGNLAMSYCAIISLLMLGDDLSRLDRHALIAGMKPLQREDGSFMAMITGSESDMRFLFCAVAISKLLNDWSGVDTERATRFIRTCFVRGHMTIPSTNCFYLLFSS